MLCARHVISRVYARSVDIGLSAQSAVIGAPQHMLRVRARADGGCYHSAVLNISRFMRATAGIIYAFKRVG